MRIGGGGGSSRSPLETRPGSSSRVISLTLRQHVTRIPLRTLAEGLMISRIRLVLLVLVSTCALSGTAGAQLDDVLKQQHEERVFQEGMRQESREIGQENRRIEEERRRRENEAAQMRAGRPIGDPCWTLSYNQYLPGTNKRAWQNGTFCRRGDASWYVR